MTLQDKAKMLIFEIWGDVETGIGTTLSTPENCAHMYKHGLMEPGEVPLYSIRCNSALEAMQFHYDHNGWGTYTPMKE